MFKKRSQKVIQKLKTGSLVLVLVLAEKDNHRAVC